MSGFKVTCPKCRGLGQRRYVVLSADRRSQRDACTYCRTCKGTGQASRKTVSVKLPADSVNVLLSCLDEIEYLNSFGAHTAVFSELKQALCERMGFEYEKNADE
ncbi:hypothetical protein [Hymenobacter ruber]